MPNPTLLSILALTLSMYFGGMWVSKIINDRNDEILSGVVKGIPVSTKYRWLMLFTNWLPYVIFLCAILLVTGTGVLELAREVEEPRVKIVGYMCAVVLVGGAGFWSILGIFVFANMLSALRDTTRR